MPAVSRPRRLPSGQWRIRWLDATGKRRSGTFAAYNEALASLSRQHVEAREIIVGARPAPPPPKTFADRTANWMETRGAAKASKSDDASVLRAHLTPAFGHLLLRDITFERIEAFKASKASYAPQTLLHQVNLLGAMLRHAERLGWLLRVPVIDRPKVRMCSTQFNYLRTTAEIQRFLRAARADGDDAYALYATAVFTGMRQGELAGLRWDRIDFDNAIITVDHSYNGTTKNGSLRHVPLQGVLLPILKAWRLRRPGVYVFTNTVGKMLKENDRIFRERFHKVLDDAGFPRATEGRWTHYIRFHDLRHTFASHWMMTGGERFKLQRILGHSSPMMTERYVHLSPTAFAADLGRFDSMGAGGEADVLPLTRPPRVASHAESASRRAAHGG